MGEREDAFVSRRYSGWHRPTPVKKKRQFRPFRAIVIFLMIAFAALYAFIFLYPQFSGGPSVTSVKATALSVIETYPEYEIGVSLIDTESAERIDIGDQSPFTAASTNKVLTAALTMHEVESGNLSLNKKFEGYTVSWHLQQLLNQSNNNSWTALNHHFGEKKMENYAKSHGLHSYDYKKNLMAPKDSATLMSKLYQGQLANKTHTQQLLKYMQHTNDDSFIPAIADTTDITVYHKYGWLESNVHDVAVLSSEKSKWVLAIFTHPKDDEMDAETSREIIHSITEATVDVIQNKS